MEPARRPLIPPHGNAEAHKRLMARLQAMTPEEKIQTLVDAGICAANGDLVEPYKSAPEFNQSRLVR
jgi:hypothetical protein